MDLKETGLLEMNINDHWYYASKAKAMTHLLKEVAPVKVLDVGAGSGFFSRYLLSNTDACEAWCVDTSYKTDFGECEAGKAVYYRRRVDKIDADLVLLMDVLEHVDKDVDLLKKYVDKVPSGSRFLISVPAFQLLWSGHDDFLEHKRRYTLKQVKGVVQNAGLEVKLGSYYFGMVFPIAALLRISQRTCSNKTPVRSQLTMHHPVVNKALKFICGLEVPFVRSNCMVGLTVFCLANKA